MGVGVVGGEFFGCFESVVVIGVSLVVGEDGVSGFEFVVDFGDGDDEVVVGEEGSGVVDWCGDLENF